jgi:hypothetical protein
MFDGKQKRGPKAKSASWLPVELRRTSKKNFCCFAFIILLSIQVFRILCGETQVRMAVPHAMCVAALCDHFLVLYRR